MIVIVFQFIPAQNKPECPDVWRRESTVECSGLTETFVVSI